MNQKALDGQQFNWDAVKHGVVKGQRYSALTWYFHWLRDQYYDMDEIVDVLICWNRLNKPPMHPEDVATIIYDLWEKRPVQSLENLTTSDIDAMLKKKESIGIGSWFIEPDMQGGYRFTAVLQDGARYESVHIPGRQTLEAVARWMPPKSKGLTFKLVVRIWLPLYRQKDIAVKLGASICGPQEWQSPQNMPEDEWKSRFVAAVKNEEKTIEDKLSKLSPIYALRTFNELYILDSYPELFEGWYGKI
jgi:hypothetical protein